MTQETCKEVGGVAGQRLKSFIERVERLEGEIGELQEDKKEVYNECKGVGFDTVIVKKIVRDRKKDREKLQEETDLYDLYTCAIGMQ